MSAPVRVARRQVARRAKQGTRGARAERKEAWSGVGWSAWRPGPRRWGWRGREEGEGGGGRAGRCARGSRRRAASDLSWSSRRLPAPPPRLGRGGRAGQRSGGRRLGRLGIGEAPPGAVKTAAAPPAPPKRSRPPGLRERGLRRPEAALERASRPRRPAAPYRLPPPAFRLCRGPGA